MCLDKIQYAFMILKSLSRAEGNFFNLKKSIYIKPTAYFVLHGERQCFPLRSGKMQGCLLSPV